MHKRTDEEILLDAYRRYRQFAKGKSYGGKNKIMGKAAELLHKADKILITFNKTTATVLENKRLLGEAKNIYQQYIKFELANAQYVTTSLEKKMDTLVRQMANYEAQRIAYFRKNEAGGDRIDIEAIFQVESNVKQLLCMAIEGILKAALSDQRFTIVSRVDQKVYITNSGRKYHRFDCPFCRRFQLTQVSYAMLENAGYTPCRCIGETDKVNRKTEKMSDEDKAELAKRTITAFIDESVRLTPLNQIDENCRQRQASYSYIICRGCLGSEDEIEPENILTENACLANEASDTLYSAIEAINAVLMKIAFRFQFRCDVIIYTDNLGAVKKWYKEESSLYLAKLFESVKVCHIPREKNTKADKVGRIKTFTDIPTKYVEELIACHREAEMHEKECDRKVNEMQCEVSRLQEELDFVKQYFPDPQHNIPNLINELRLLADERKASLQ